MTNPNFQNLDLNYYKQIAERVVRERAEEREARKNKPEAQPEVQEEQEERTMRMPESAKSRKDYVFVPSLGLYVSENRYLQDKDWNQTQEILHKENKRMPTIPEFVEFLKYLRSREGKAKVKNADKILDEVYTVREPWRSEWLDADFKVKGKELYVNYHIFDVRGNIVQKSEKLEEHLTKDATPGIDLESWLDNPTKQGLPKAECNKGSLYYWYPRSDNNSVARFVADSGGASLYCGGSPDDHDAGLGVRYVEPRRGETASKKIN